MEEERGMDKKMGDGERGMDEETGKGKRGRERGYYWGGKTENW